LKESFVKGRTCSSSEDRIAFRDTLKRFISKEVATIADEVDRNNRLLAGILKVAEGWHAVPGIEPVEDRMNSARRSPS
jgi:hypothetical protein